jgi:hypothetical protein
MQLVIWKEEFFMNKKSNFMMILAILSMLVPAFCIKTVNAISGSTIDNGIEYKLDSKEKTACLTDGRGASGNIEIPATVVDKDISYNVTSVGERAFSGAMLKSIALPDSVEVLGSGAFERCENLMTISLSGSLKKIEADAFFWSGITYIIIPESVESIGERAFGQCARLSRAELPEQLSYCGKELFSGCILLENVTLPNNIKTIPEKMFYGCEKLSEIAIPAGVETIGANAFVHCKFNELELPQTLTTIGSHAFDYCSELNYVVLPENTSTIEDGAFSRCENLSYIEIPESVVNIGYHAFGSSDPTELTKLKKVICIKNSYVDEQKPFFFWVQYGVTYPEFSYKVSGASASGSIFGEYSFMAYVAVGVFLMAIVMGIVTVFRGKDEDENTV